MLNTRGQGRAADRDCLSTALEWPPKSLPSPFFCPPSFCHQFFCQWHSRLLSLLSAITENRSIASAPCCVVGVGQRCGGQKYIWHVSL